AAVGPLPLHDALPISGAGSSSSSARVSARSPTWWWQASTSHAGVPVSSPIHARSSPVPAIFARAPPIFPPASSHSAQAASAAGRSEEHTSELQSRENL